MQDLTESVDHRGLSTFQGQVPPRIGAELPIDVHRIDRVGIG